MRNSKEYIYLYNKPVDELIDELQKLKEKYKNNTLYIGHRICFNECDTDCGDCICDTYSIEIFTNERE